jgi:hypothetical protein
VVASRRPCPGQPPRPDGLGLGLFEPANSAAALQAVSPAEMSMAGATLSVPRNLGMTLGTATAATRLDHHLATRTGTLAERVTSGMHLALLTGSASDLLGAMVAALRPRWRPALRS